MIVMALSLPLLSLSLPFVKCSNNYFSQSPKYKTTRVVCIKCLKAKNWCLPNTIALLFLIQELIWDNNTSAFQLSSAQHNGHLVLTRQ